MTKHSLYSYCQAVIKVVSIGSYKCYTHRHTQIHVFSLLMLESNFEEIYLGMQFHNETEGPSAEEARSIKCNNRKMWTLKSRCTLFFYSHFMLNIWLHVSCFSTGQFAHTGNSFTKSLPEVTVTVVASPNTQPYHVPWPTHSGPCRWMPLPGAELVGEVRWEDWVIISVQLPEAAVDHTARLSVHLLPSNLPLDARQPGPLSGPSDCHASAASPRRPGRADCWGGGMRWMHGAMGKGDEPTEKAFV